MNNSTDLNRRKNKNVSNYRAYLLSSPPVESNIPIKYLGNRTLRAKKNIDEIYNNIYNENGTKKINIDYFIYRGPAGPLNYDKYLFKEIKKIDKNSEIMYVIHADILPLGDKNNRSPIRKGFNKISYGVQPKNERFDIFKLNDGKLFLLRDWVSNS
jgi:hypothetical protein